MPFIFVFLLLFLGSCASDSGTTATDTTTTNYLTTETIVTDGESADWSLVTSFYADDTSDQTTDSDENKEIINIYFAEDDTYIYARIDVKGEITMPHTSTADYSYINVFIQPYNGDCAVSTKITGRLIAVLYADDTYSAAVLNEYEDGSGEAITATTNIVSAASGSVLEIEIPKANLFSNTTHVMLSANMTSDTGSTVATYDELDPDICFTLYP
ncbi:MAG: hypothetical protein QNL04_03750 [SAR324 cluster bacterium]|nr:hypothetical protein [SAR324 cluster bacterium]